MIYSYAACFAAATLRLWLPALTSLTNDFIPAYRMVAWLCWIPNLVFAHYLQKKTMAGNGTLTDQRHKLLVKRNGKTKDILRSGRRDGRR